LKQIQLSQNLTTALLAITIAFGLTMAYFKSPLRVTIENKLFDLRSRLSWQTERDELVKVVLLEPRVAGESQSPALDLSRLLAKIAVSRPQAIGLLLYKDLILADDPHIYQLVDQIIATDNLWLGAITDDVQGFGPESLPFALQGIAERVAPFSFQLDYPNEVVRRLPLRSQDFNKEISYFPLAVVRGMGIDSESAANLIINYSGFDNNGHFAAQDILRDELTTDFQDKVVLIGLGGKAAGKTKHGTANTPWQEDDTPLELAVPSIRIIAQGISNLIHGTQLQPLRGMPEIMVQTVLICGVGFFSWAGGVAMSALSLLFTAIILLMIHLVMISQFGTIVPLADTAFFGSLFTLFGGLFRLKNDVKNRAIHLAKLETEKQLAEIQSRYLNRLCFTLSQINRKFLEQILGLKVESESAAIRDKTISATLELQEYLKGIESFVEIQTARDRSYKGSGKGSSLQIRPERLKPLIENVVKRFAHQWQQRQIKVLVHASAHVQAAIDGLLFEQILANLLSNAIKYSPENSTVQIKVREKSPYTYVEVQDQGPGIPLEEREKIFEKFYRIKNDAVYRVKGTGLGLYLSGYFAKQMAATLTVLESESGAHFELQLNR
jgi:signal transduction histidine kinase